MKRTKPRRKQFEVMIERSAVETVSLKVLAHDQYQAERIVSDILDQPQRIDITDLFKVPEIKRVGESECNGDEESSWEVI